jgi:hypothetical protein
LSGVIHVAGDLIDPFRREPAERDTHHRWTFLSHGIAHRSTDARASPGQARSTVGDATMPADLNSPSRRGPTSTVERRRSARRLCNEAQAPTAEMAVTPPSIKKSAPTT